MLLGWEVGAAGIDLGIKDLSVCRFHEGRIVQLSRVIQGHYLYSAMQELMRNAGKPIDGRLQQGQTKLIRHRLRKERLTVDNHIAIGNDQRLGNAPALKPM